MLRPSQIFTNLKAWKDLRSHEIQHCSNASLHDPDLASSFSLRLKTTHVVSPDVGHSGNTELLESSSLL